MNWAGARFRYQETVSPRQENEVEAAPRAGAIATLTNVELGKAPEDMTRA